MRYELAIISLLALAFMISPAGAFSAHSLQIDVAANGDANVTFDYSLSWLETIAVFFKIAQPEQELKGALEDVSGKPVSVVSVESNSAVFSVIGFAAVTETESGKVYTTPGMDFTAAEEKLKSYWFAPLISADFSPDVTSILFPDGYEETFYDQSFVPFQSHEVS
jgi:hypothetical protein